jgi:lysozyme
MTLLERVLQHEGFESKPYQDTLGIWTVGHGLTYLTPDESSHIVERRLYSIENSLKTDHPWLRSQPKDIPEVLTEMCFQLGYAGCHKFVNMWAALEDKRYAHAADEMLDSKWAEQTPNRALVLSSMVRRHA